ncbi:layilin isoform X2 [Gouania willdenowi]|uniref:layilin isoform X2 n=1 Tax=Gouania willdenowi TaxID=441366 RepID=UPI0010550B93|nr:layilin-like isoform X2 [Gouania willdenowi]
MDVLLVIVCHLFILHFHPSAATNLITDIFEAQGQRVCKAGKGKPCYKLAYFSELRRRLNFAEAALACSRDGGQLLSVESASEQKIIEQLVAELRPTDGDFWIGLRRDNREEESNLDCSAQYHWLDGSKSTFRNWHWDEPSCGYEVCVVMYHQPSAPPGLGGLYMFQWNDDNCETKNNFICKYTAGKPMKPSPSPNTTQTGIVPSTVLPWNPSDSSQSRPTAVNLVYIIIPTIPLILLLLTVLGVCCFKMLGRRRRPRQKTEKSQTDSGNCPSSTTTEVYNVIRSQKDDDLVSSRPHTKNTSFLCSSPDTPTGDYDNLGGRDTESGFVTLASTESCFLNFDVNDLSLGRRGNRDFYDTSLGRPGKRELNDGSLGRAGHREFYDRSLGRRTTKSEHYGSAVCAEPGLYDQTTTHPVKTDLYQTYVTCSKDDTFQTSLRAYENRKSYQTTLDYYKNGLNLDGRRYFNEREWINGGNY